MFGHRRVSGVLLAVVLLAGFHCPALGQSTEPAEPMPSHRGRLIVAYLTWSADDRSPQFTDLVRGLFAELSKDANFARRFSEIDFKTLDYDDSLRSLQGKEFILIISPWKYAMADPADQQNLVPLMVLTNGAAASPYYSAAIIAAKNSRIDSINSPEIKRVYHLGENSLTGYQAPIDLLWRTGIIPTPDEAGLRSRGWDPYGPPNVSRHEDVLAKVSADPSSMGFVYFDPRDNSTKVLARFGLYPNEIICVSHDLTQYQTAIEAYFGTHPDQLKGAPLDSNGVIPFSDEFKSSISQLSSLRKPPAGYRYVPGAPILHRPAAVIMLLTCILATCIRILRSKHLWDVRWPIAFRLSRIVLIAVSTIFDGFLVLAVLCVVLIAVGKFAKEGFVRSTLIEPTTDIGAHVAGISIALLLGVVASAVNVFQRVQDASPGFVQHAIGILTNFDMARDVKAKRHQRRNALRAVPVIQPAPEMTRTLPDDAAASTPAEEHSRSASPKGLSPAENEPIPHSPIHAPPDIS